MKGIIERFTDFNKLNKRKKKSRKKRNYAGSTFRDYRGVDGVVDDAQRSGNK